jgi:phosphoglycerate dehydrogenase-like enzyme
MAKPINVLILNQISQNGLKRLPAERYQVGKDIANPDAVMVRSADMHKMDIPPSVQAIGRAGAGTNNIPVKAMSARGVPVFNAPGANANAVKELVVAGMLLAARNIGGAMKFVSGLDPADPEMEKKVEDGKKNFAGFELAGHTLGVIGLGKIGCLVADVAIKLGMNVLGYDPEITVDAAWSLPSQVKKANSVAEVLKHADFISMHVPLVDATRKMINADMLAHARHGAVLLNFSREGVVDEAPCWPRWRRRSWPPTSAISQPACQWPSPCHRAAASGRLHRGSRRKLRHHGGRPAARVHGTRQRAECGELPERDHAARVELPHRRCQFQRAQHAGPDFDRDGQCRPQHPQHDEQVEAATSPTPWSMWTARCPAR